MAADLVGSTSTFALSIHEVIVQVNLTTHVDYNPNSTAMLNSKQHLGPRAVVGHGIKIVWPGLFITLPDHLGPIVVESRTL